MGMYKKLVRDKIPDKIKQNGEKPLTRVLEREEFITELKAKLVEEATECAAAADKDTLTEELADLEEVILTLLSEFQITPQAVEDARQHKRDKRGGFEKRIYLEGSE